MFWHDSSNGKVKNPSALSTRLCDTLGTAGTLLFHICAPEFMSEYHRFFEHKIDPWENGNKQTLPDNDGINFV